LWGCGHCPACAKSADESVELSPSTSAAINLVHIGARAERKVERELLEDLKRVTGKQTLLFEIADAAAAFGGRRLLRPTPAAGRG
jgi:hypothetical protein